MDNLAIAQRYLEALAAEDFETASQILDPDAEVVLPGGTVSGTEFITGVRTWEGFDDLDVETTDRVLTEEDGVVVSRARRVFRWKETGEVAYEQAAEVRLTFHDGKIRRAEVA
jgi:ketosteroid isomerase-like protein